MNPKNTPDDSNIASTQASAVSWPRRFAPPSSAQPLSQDQIDRRFISTTAPDVYKPLRMYYDRNGGRFADMGANWAAYLYAAEEKPDSTERLYIYGDNGKPNLAAWLQHLNRLFNSAWQSSSSLLEELLHLRDSAPGDEVQGANSLIAPLFDAVQSLPTVDYVESVDTAVDNRTELTKEHEYFQGLLVIFGEKLGNRIPGGGWSGTSLLEDGLAALLANAKESLRIESAPVDDLSGNYVSDEALALVASAFLLPVPSPRGIHNPPQTPGDFPSPSGSLLLAAAGSTTIGLARRTAATKQADATPFDLTMKTVSSPDDPAATAGRSATISATATRSAASAHRQQDNGPSALSQFSEMAEASIGTFASGAFDAFEQSMARAAQTGHFAAAAFGQAMKGIAANTVKSIGQQSIAKAGFEVGEGFKSLADKDSEGAGHHFASAGEFFALGTLAGAAGGAMGPKGGGSAGGSSASKSTSPAGANPSGQTSGGGGGGGVTQNITVIGVPDADQVQTIKARFRQAS